MIIKFVIRCKAKRRNYQRFVSSFKQWKLSKRVKLKSLTASVGGGVAGGLPILPRSYTQLI